MHEDNTAITETQPSHIVTDDQEPADIAFLMDIDKDQDDPTVESDDEVTDETRIQDSADDDEGQAADASENESPSATQEKDADRKIRELQEKYSAAMRELNKHWAEKKQQTQQPEPPVDPVKSKIESHRQLLARQESMVQARMKEAQELFPDADEDQHEKYAEYWGNQDFMDWRVEDRVTKLRESDPVYQQQKAAEVQQRQQKVVGFLDENKDLLSDNDVNANFFTTLKRYASRLEKQDNTPPGQYYDPATGLFSVDFETHPEAESLIQDAMGVAIGVVKRDEMKQAVKDAYEKGLRDQRTNAKKKRVKTTVPRGSGISSFDSSDDDEFILSIANASQF